MEDLQIKARKITANLKNTFPKFINTIQTVTLQLENRFQGITDKEEALNLVKIWISSEQMIKENWDVAFLLSNYKMEKRDTLRDFAKNILSVNTEDKEEMYQIFGMIQMRNVDYEVRTRLLKYYRKAYGTKTFFKKVVQTINVDNVQERITRNEYFLLIHQDLQRLEEKYRVPIANAKNEEELKNAWANYQKYLSLTFYFLTLTKDDDMVPILENVSGIPFRNEIIEVVENELNLTKLELFEKYELTEYHYFFYYVIKIFENADDKDSLKFKSTVAGLNQANDWLGQFMEIEENIPKLSNKEAEEIECLNIFFPKKIADYLDLKEIDGKRHELTVLYKSAVNKKVTNSTTNRRTNGVKNRAEYLRSVKQSTRNKGLEIHKDLVKGNSIIEISQKFGLSKPAVYKQLYAYYYYRLYNTRENRKLNLSEEELQKLVCTKHNINAKHLQSAIKKFNKNQ